LTAGDNLFGRLSGRTRPQALEPQAVPAAGLHVRLDHQGRVVSLSGTLRQQLAAQGVAEARPLLRDLLCAGSALSVEGHPADWQC
jgi:hypothetical protein